MGGQCVFCTVNNCFATLQPRPGLMADFPSIISLRTDQAHQDMEVFHEGIGKQVLPVMDN